MLQLSENINLILNVVANLTQTIYLSYVTKHNYVNFNQLNTPKANIVFLKLI